MVFAESRTGARFRECRVHRRDAARDDTRNVVTLVKSRGKGAADKFAGTCYTCGKVGHRTTKCRFAEEMQGHGVKWTSTIGGGGNDRVLHLKTHTHKGYGKIRDKCNFENFTWQGDGKNKFKKQDMSNGPGESRSGNSLKNDGEDETEKLT